ncbi:calcitonin protein-related peptide 2 [Sigmodon hispidus]
MGFWKFFPFLALSSVWILCLASSLQAAPFKEVLEGSLDQATLSEQEKHLLDALMQNYYKEFKARKLEQKEQNVEDSSYGNKQLAKDQIITSEMLLKRLLLASASMTAQKRGCRTATCVTQRLPMAGAAGTFRTKELMALRRRLQEAELTMSINFY